MLTHSLIQAARMTLRPIALCHKPRQSNRHSTACHNNLCCRHPRCTSASTGD